MSCEIFKSALNEAAATRSGPAGDLRVHLEACADCRAEFACVRTTFAAIDAHLSAIANMQPSSAFLPRVRSRLEQGTTPKLNWTPVGLAGAVAAAMVLAVMFFPLLQHKDTPQPQPVQSSRAQQNQSSTPVVPQADQPRQEAHTVLKRSASVPRPLALGSARRSVPREPQVIVPQEERVAFGRFLSAVQRGEVALALGETPARDEQKLLQVDPIEVAKLSIAPLDGRADWISTGTE